MVVVVTKLQMILCAWQFCSCLWVIMVRHGTLLNSVLAFGKQVKHQLRWLWCL